ncbi:MAG: phosphodiesterase [Rhizobiaceae bacterium]|nr:phosphodiesterase [Rhizobiaceae bacterium]MCV0406872.1 phosphodiesterase [Rhizobiaceae bacterium]
MSNIPQSCRDFLYLIFSGLTFGSTAVFARSEIVSASAEPIGTGSLLRIQKAEPWLRVAAAALVALLLLGATVIVYASGGTRFAYVHVTYIAIIAGAAFFALPGGLVTAALASLLMGPFMPLNVAAGIDQTPTNWLVRAGFFVLIGGLAGFAFQMQNRQLQLIRRQGFYNPLTGLPNRARCLERLDELIRSETAKQSPVVLVCLRHGQLGTIASTLGHEQAGALQKAVASRLKSILPKDAKLFHVSSGVFALVVFGTQEEAARVGAKLVDALDEPVVIDGVPILCNAYVGLARYGVHASDALALLRASLSALQDVEPTGQRVGVFDAEKDRVRRERLRLLPDLQRALRASGEITLHYQPQVDLRTGACIGAEALVRWHHPERGQIAPAEFVPLAEQTALIGPLAERVLNLAIAQLALWQNEGLDLRLAVNLAIRNLEDDELPGTITALLRQHCVSPSKLEIEVTESGLMGRLDKVAGTLTALREHGVKVALDDFGTGQSSIAYLRDLPADILKLDRSFLRDDAATDARSRMLLATAVEGCHRLGFQVAAEGIETQQAYDLLRGLSCDYGQGFFIAKPMPPPRFRSWLSEQRRTEHDDRAAFAPWQTSFVGTSTQAGGSSRGK